MSKDIVAFCLEFGLNEKSELIQSFDGEPLFVLGGLISSFRLNRASDFNKVFIILKNFYARQKEIGPQLIGRTINEILKNEPTIFSQLNNVLAQKEKIAKMMFEGKDKEDETSEEEIFEWIKHLQAGLLKVKYINARRL